MPRKALRLALTALCATLALSGCTFSYGGTSSGRPPAVEVSSNPTQPPSQAPTSPAPSSQPSSHAPSSQPSSGSKGTIKQAYVESRTAEEIKQKTGKAIAVNCPHDLEARVGATMTCKAQAGGETASLVLTVTSVSGDRVNWSIKGI